MPAQPTEMCENCTVRRIDLRRCAGCSLVRYCMVRRADALGADYSDRFRAIGKWCEMFSLPIGAASASALDIMNHPEHIDEFMLVIYVDFLGATAKPPYTHAIVEAAALPLAPLRSRALAISQAQLEQFERNLAPRPGVIRVLLLDRTFPWSYTTPFRPPSDVKQWRRDRLWFKHLQMAVTRPGEKVRRREEVRLDKAEEDVFGAAAVGA
ncbi:hypothetical protein DFH09DRAFT_1121631 [Mycena vulgaris]|nr:hypothetical protein DFH09DRAFT_1121631 [Mycena vulgaris]